MRRRLYLYFTLLMLIPVVILGLILYVESDRRLSKSTLQGAQTEMLRAAASTDAILQDVLDIMDRISADEDLQGWCSREISKPFDEEYLTGQISRKLKQLNQSYSTVSCCYVFLDNGIRGKSRYYDYLDTILIPKTKLKMVHDHSGIEWIRGLNGSLITDNKNSGVLTALSGYENHESGKMTGIIAVEVHLEQLNDILNVELGEGGSIYICNTLGNVEAGKIKNLEHVSLAQDVARREIVSSRIKQFDEGDVYSLVARLSTNGWVLIGIMPKEFLRENGREILMITLLIFGIFALINVFISTKLCEYELVPIRLLQTYVRRVEQGAFGEELTPVRNDEIGELTRNVTHMSANLGELISKVREDEETLRLTEYKALQAQIQPHFLYNTLDSINWLILKGDNEKAHKMLTALTGFFRISLSGGEDLIPIEDEVSHVENYLKIQKIRFSQMFEYQIFFDETLNGCFVPKLILQPLVENALYHGIRGCDRMNLLLVNLLRDGEKIICEVRDDGLGMPKETLDKLNSGVYERNPDSGGGYGLCNINDRIHILAGEAYGLHFESEENLGTSVRITLPSDLRGVTHV